MVGKRGRARGEWERVPCFGVLSGAMMTMVMVMVVMVVVVVMVTAVVVKRTDRCRRARVARQAGERGAHRTRQSQPTTLSWSLASCRQRQSATVVIGARCTVSSVHGHASSRRPGDDRTSLLHRRRHYRATENAWLTPSGTARDASA